VYLTISETQIAKACILKSISALNCNAVEEVTDLFFPIVTSIRVKQIIGKKKM